MTHGTLLLGPDIYDVYLAIKGDRIFDCGIGAPGEDWADATIPCEGLKLKPGRVNAHTHIYSGLAPLGLPAPKEKPENFHQILERIWWRLDRALDEPALRASARYYVAEALLAGTTTLIDHHESPRFMDGSLDVLADACDELGMRAVLCFGATERNGGRSEAKKGLRECQRFLKSNRRPLVKGAVGLHASFTVSDETVREAGRLCRNMGAVLHVHVAEDGIDVTDAEKRGYAGPLERLKQLEALPPGSILAHGVHLKPAQVRRAQDAALWFVQNPRSNRGNGVGYPSALNQSRLVALGTDGYPSRLDDEARALFDEGEKHGEKRSVLDQRVIAGWDLAGELFGARFSPVDEGSPADIVAWDGETARHVIAGGRIVVRDGKLVTGDIETIRAAAQEEARRLWDRMEKL
jgi:cytosine/adenosine deaminase-related metal-dependent hydrolase